MPETVISNTQNQQYTISDDGNNVRPALIGNSHFFLESSGDGAFSQASSGKFGAISDTQFRTTANVTFAGSKKVYAICQGQVFVQPQTGSTSKVNVILRPYKHAIRELPIKYFIYRGLKLSDFVSGSGGTAQVAGSDSSGSGFVQHIWKEFNKFYENENSGDTPPAFLAKMIGFSDGSDQQDSDLIDSYFNKITLYTDPDQQNEDPSIAYELPLIAKGMHLGDADGALGLDIVLNNGDYYVESDTSEFQFNLKFARAATHVLDTGVVTGTTPEDLYQKKLIKQASAQFLDAAAFYGLHCNGLSKVFVNDSATPLETKASIYAHLKNFHTKHTQYIYVQDNRQRSYNFYGNYNYGNGNTSDFKIGDSQANMTETNFGTSGWSVHEVDNQENTFIQLTTDNHEEAVLYAKLGVLNTAHEQNLVRKTNLLQSPSNDTSNPTDPNYTQPVGFTALVENTNAIASCVQVIYEGKQTSFNAEGSLVLSKNDSLFGLLNAKSFFKKAATSNGQYSITDLGVKVMYMHKEESPSAVIVKRTEDSVINTTTDQAVPRVTFETSLQASISESLLSSKNNASASGERDFSKVVMYQENESYKLNSPYNLLVTPFQDVSNNLINGLELSTYDNSKLSKVVLGITTSEEGVVNQVITDNSIKNPMVYLKPHEESNQGSQENSFGVTYYHYSIALIGDEDISNGSISSIDTSIPIYSLDKRVFFSKDYSEFVEQNEAEVINQSNIQTED
jgi:hypothetical protein